MRTRKNDAPARKEGLIVQKLGDEVIVYDRASHRAHSLNRPATLVFETLDGRKDLKGIAQKVGKELGAANQDAVVASAVNELAAADLLRPGAILPRRVALRGIAAALAPMVVTIAVPSAADAATCVPEGGECFVSDDYGYETLDCCPGFECSFNYPFGVCVPCQPCE